MGTHRSVFVVFFIALVLLLCSSHLAFGCSVIEITTDLPNAKFLEGVYILEPSLVSDGRPVYIEVMQENDADSNTNRKMLYHWSHAQPDENDTSINVDEYYENAEFVGKWIVGRSIYSSSGWAYINSWSISPSDDIMHGYASLSMKNTGFADSSRAADDDDVNVRTIIANKLRWNLLLDEDWVQTDAIAFLCRSIFTDAGFSESADHNADHSLDFLNAQSYDWLFITAPNAHNLKEMNVAYNRDMDIETKTTELESITNENVHGFYYRIAKHYWRKIESTIFLRSLKMPANADDHEDEDDDEDAFAIEYRFFQYNQELRSSGKPIDIIDTFNNERQSHRNKQTRFDYDEESLVLYINGYAKQSEDMTSVDIAWSQHIFGNVDFSETADINVVALKASDSDSDGGATIYEVVRNYYSKLKYESMMDTIESSIEDEYEYLSASPASSRDSAVNKATEMEAALIAYTNNGLPFAMLGLGTGGLADEQNAFAMAHALRIGYRLIDSGEAYYSEQPLGALLQTQARAQNTDDVDVERDAVYVTSKVWPTNLGFIQTYRSILGSLNKLKTSYIDLYMVHWPECRRDFSWMDCTQASPQSWWQSWQIMEKLYAEGYLLNIGVSNFEFFLFQTMVESQHAQIFPQVLQNYFDIQHQDWELASYVRKFGVIFQAYAHFRGIAQAKQRHTQPFYQIWSKRLKHMAAEKTVSDEYSLYRLEHESETFDVSASQICLRWLLASNISVIPRSKSVEHLHANWNLWAFEFTESDMQLLTKRSIEANGQRRDEL